MRRHAVLAVAVAFAPVIAACDANQTPPLPDGHAIVSHHVDGDTIDVTIAGATERIRLIGIDTPEVAHAGTPERPGNPAECVGDEAAAATAALLPIDTEVRLVRDVVARDDYGRLLAYVYRASDNLFVNLEIVRAGHATPLSIAPNTAFAADIVEAARTAEQANLGLWAECS